MSTDTLSKHLGTWKAQIANAKARLPQMPQLGETVQGFEALVLEGEELQSSQDVYRSKPASPERFFGEFWLQVQESTPVFRLI